jgi:hypothetical protein
MLMVVLGLLAGFSSSVCLSAPSEQRISERVAVVTELPLAVDVIYWEISLQTDLASNRLKVKATCTLQNKGQVPVDNLDFDILAREKFYAVQVEIARIARLIGGKEVEAKFKRSMEQKPEDPSQAGTRKYPVVTRVSLSPVLKEGEECRLVFDYTITCLDITKKRNCNLIWELEQGKKETCLITDFAWFPKLTADVPKRLELGKKNFFLRWPKPAWQVTLTHPVGLEGMVIDGKLRKSERVGEQVISQWRSIIGGRPQVFIGPSERVEKKGEAVTVVFLLPKGKYDPEFVDEIGDVSIQAYQAYMDWFGPLDGNEIRVVATSGIGSAHGAFLGMTATVSYFQGMSISQTVPDELVLAHELAHSWWGCSVSSCGRGTKFLRESLANFSTWHLAREHYGRDLFKFYLDKYIFAVGREKKPLFNADSDEEEFAYTKGAVVLDILRQEMGDEVFFRVLKEFARRYRNGHATFIDFVSLWKRPRDVYRLCVSMQRGFAEGLDALLLPMVLWDGMPGISFGRV